MSLKLTIPDSISEAIRFPEGRIKEGLLDELAVALYSDKLISYGKARELAAKSKYEFSVLLGKKGIERHYSEKELSEDVKYASVMSYL